MMNEYPFLVGGRWRTGAAPIEVRFPYTGESVALVHQAGKQDCLDAVACAKMAFETTRRLSSADRCRILSDLSCLVAKHSEEFVDILVLEGGKTRSSAQQEVVRAATTLRISSEEAGRINGELLPLDWTADTVGRFGITKRVPLGPVLGITPFNFPLNLACHKIGPAIAAGNPIIMKPASATPVSLLLLGRLALETGLPPEALSILPCPAATAEIMVRDPRIAVLTFTGSPMVGWHLKQISGSKKVILEHGGNAAVIVHSDAMLPYAVSRIVTGAFSNAGQVCISVQRVFIAESVYYQTLDMIQKSVAALKTGDPRDPGTDIGPMITEEAASRAENLVREAVEQGATLLCGGKQTGALFTPTVVTDTSHEMRINCEEAFAPLITVHKYETFNEALSEANRSDFGMQIGIFTNYFPFILQAFEDAEVGGVIVNDIPTFRADQMPYGGIKASGAGKEGPRYAIREMTEEKILVINPQGGLP
ncbi:MAG: aldehyde dehydrogenase family protein [Methanoregulaceae archaeon]|jgi:acyl-CoA reductase-like NAD-dependent aldehyde dehydrogenase|nr:aldehyde dehydrogenase family protein [Methanoregulaceae archaeon]